MIYKLQRKQSSEFLTSLVMKQQVKSSTKTPPVNRSTERKPKMIRKRSSKEKQLILESKTLDSDPSLVCSCPKLKTYRIANSYKVFDAILDDDFNETRRLIIEEYFDINEYSMEGNTPLHIASATGNLDCLKLLIECGARLEALDDYKRTPLEYAVLYGNFDCACLLLENGADPKVIKDGIH